MALVNEYYLTIRGKTFAAFMNDENATIANEIINEINNPKQKYHTYFVSYIENYGKYNDYGNTTFSTTSTGLDLAKDVIAFIAKDHPNRIVMNITKLD